jgi:hypothetical protein
MVIEVKPDWKNAAVPIVVTLGGMVTEVREEQ